MDVIKLQIGDQVIGIPGEILSQAIIDAAPAWIVANHPAPPAPDIKAAAGKATLKAFLPAILAFIHMESIKQGHPLPSPDFKSDVARANSIAYAIRYLFDNFAAIASQIPFIAQGETNEDGVFIVTGIISPSADVGQTQAAETGMAATGPSPTADEQQWHSRQLARPLAHPGIDGDGQDDVCEESSKAPDEALSNGTILRAGK